MPAITHSEDRPCNRIQFFQNPRLEVEDDHTLPLGSLPQDILALLWLHYDGFSLALMNLSVGRARAFQPDHLTASQGTQEERHDSQDQDQEGKRRGTGWLPPLGETLQKPLPPPFGSPEPTLELIDGPKHQPATKRGLFLSPKDIHASIANIRLPRGLYPSLIGGQRYCLRKSC